jgi:hypothetical protein
MGGAAAKTTGGLTDGVGAYDEKGGDAEISGGGGPWVH